jgi:nicotinate-nucleotide pyrophosphorylase (carboxylating)
VAAEECVGTIEGPARGLLGAERILLNLLGRLSGIATLTRRYVDAVAGTKARIYDTRKTTPGWRRLEKYAVRCGGGWNHRGGLDEAVLIKDNHLALAARSAGAGTAAERWSAAFTPAEAVARARRFIWQHVPPLTIIVEVEVDTLEQLDAVLGEKGESPSFPRSAWEPTVGDAGSHAERGNQNPNNAERGNQNPNSPDPFFPDIVLLDNMTPAQLREAVARRDAAGATVELEASGGVDLATVGAIAAAGVERISVGALTHSAVALDFGLDWE